MKHAEAQKTHERNSKFDNVSITLITGLIIKYHLGSLNVMSFHLVSGTPQGDFHQWQDQESCLHLLPSL